VLTVNNSENWFAWAYVLCNYIQTIDNTDEAVQVAGQSGDVWHAWRDVIVIIVACCSSSAQCTTALKTQRQARRHATKDAIDADQSRMQLATQSNSCAPAQSGLVYWWINCSRSRSRCLVLLCAVLRCCCCSIIRRATSTSSYWRLHHACQLSARRRPTSFFVSSTIVLSSNHAE